MLDRDDAVKKAEQLAKIDLVLPDKWPGGLSLTSISMRLRQIPQDGSYDIFLDVSQDLSGTTSSAFTIQVRPGAAGVGEEHVKAPGNGLEVEIATNDRLFAWQIGGNTYIARGIAAGITRQQILAVAGAMDTK